MKQQAIDTKANLPDSGEADESLFEYLHAEMVDYVLSSRAPNTKDGEEDLTPLEWMGFGVGYRIMERLTREWARFKDELDTIKFICTDLWSSLHRKQIDNLRTNHQGVYVLHDYAFRLLTNIGAPNSSQYLREAPRLLAFTCGLLRGSLANLGIVSTVTAEISTVPSSINVEAYNVQPSPYRTALTSAVPIRRVGSSSGTNSTRPEKKWKQTLWPLQRQYSRSSQSDNVVRGHR